MNDDLVDSLREVTGGKLASKPRTEYIRADTVAAMVAEARIEELEADLSEQIEWVKRLADDLIASEEREERLEAKLAQAVEVLSLYHDMMCDGFCFDLHLNSEYAVAMAKECVGCKARAFLATIQNKGETDDKA
jgi:uncharacterized coiled-coil protein SlyX